MGAKTLAHYLAGEVPVLRLTVKSLQRLNPPSKLVSLHAQVVATVNGQATLFSTLAKEAKAGKLTAAQWQNNPKLRDLNVRELALWKQIGAKGCASP